MSDRKPLVLAPDPAVGEDGSVIVQRLQAGDDLDIPLTVRVARLELLARELLVAVLDHGLDLPSSALSFLEEIQ